FYLCSCYLALLISYLTPFVVSRVTPYPFTHQCPDDLLYPACLPPSLNRHIPSPRHSPEVVLYLFRVGLHYAPTHDSSIAVQHLCRYGCNVRVHSYILIVSHWALLW